MLVSLEWLREITTIKNTEDDIIEKIPERKMTSSDSFLCDIAEFNPVFLLCSSFSIMLKSIDNPEGQPSMTPPIAAPCDSPKMVRLKLFPNVFAPIIKKQRAAQIRTAL